MTGSSRKLLSVYLTTLIVLSMATPAFTGVATAAGNTEGTLSGGVANQPTATMSKPAVTNMSTGVIAQSADADVTVGWDFSPLSGQYDTSNTTLRLSASGVNSGQPIVTASISSYSGTKTLTIPSSQYQFGPGQQNFTLRLYNPNSNFGVLASDTETLEVRSVASSPAVDMRNFSTRGNGNTQIQVGYDAAGQLNGKSLKIRMVGPNANTVTTSDLNGDPRGAATMTVPANFGEGQVTFELHIGGVDGTPDATATAQHTLEAYISSQSIAHVSGTQPTIANISVESQTIRFGQGGMFQFTLVDATKGGFGNRDLSGSNVGADESTLLWVNFTVENYAPDVLMGPGDVEEWQFSTTGGTADIDILVHPTSVY